MSHHCQFAPVKLLLQMTENYLVRLLLGEMVTPESISLKKYKEKLLDDIGNRDIINILIYHLTQFTSYLTYRSNGTPKKLKGCYQP